VVKEKQVETQELAETIKKKIISEIRSMAEEQLKAPETDEFEAEEMRNNLDNFVHQIEHTV
jgi:soluble cytochrome b562